MTVGELIEKLQEVNPNLDVVLAKDREGNRVSPLADFDEGVYAQETRDSGSFRVRSERSWRDGVPDALCLWPEN